MDMVRVLHKHFSLQKKGIKGITIEALWILATFACIFMMVSLYPLYPNDFWWHLKVGELIYTTHSIPATNLFAWSIDPATPYTYAAWLSELSFYLLFRLGGIKLVLFLRNLLALGTFFLVMLEAFRRSHSWRITALVLMLAFLLSTSNLTVRPQIWSWLLFMIFVTLLSRYSAGQLNKNWLLACPILMIFWVNLHGAFLLGIILFGIYFSSEFIHLMTRLPGSLPGKEVRWLGFMSILTALGTLCNPKFLRIYQYVIDISKDKQVQQLITEWQPPTLQEPEYYIFFGSILILLTVLIYSRYRPKSTDLLLILVFLWLAWTSKRFVAWYALVVMPVLGEAIKGLPIQKIRASPRRNWFNNILAALLFIPGFLAQPWMVDHVDFPLPYQDRVLVENNLGPLLSTETPINAVDFLNKNPGGKLFNEMGYGSYLIWALPGQPVFIDPRVELYSYDQWIDCIQISQGLMYNELLGKYGADRILLNIKLQLQLSQSLEKDPGWRKEYEDRYAQVWRRIQ